MASHTQHHRGHLANTALLLAAQLIFLRNLFSVLIRAESSIPQQIGHSLETHRGRATEYFRKLRTWSANGYMIKWGKSSYAETSSLQRLESRLQVRAEEEKEPTAPPPPHLEFVPDGNLEWDKPVAVVSDPKEEKLNERIEANGVEIWPENPCHWYNAYSTSHPNKKRKKHCRDAVDHLRKAGFKDNDSPLCPIIEGADCFQFKDHVQSGRCYARVNNHGHRSYVLLNNCVRDWMETKHIKGTSWPTGRSRDNDTLPATPEAPPDEGNLLFDGDPKYQQPEERPDDPPDEVFNRDLTVNGHLIWYKNPCRAYGRETHSFENDGRKKGCHNIVQHMHEAGFENGKSQLCPQIDGADCFEFREDEMDGRCYGKVKTKDGQLKYILLYHCIRDWQKQNNLTHAPQLIPEGDGYYAQPELKPTDMSDDQMDRSLVVGSTWIWDTNPCRFYVHEEFNPAFPPEGENVRHEDNCRNAVKYMRDAGFGDGKSKLCPHINGADCFQFKDNVKSGRCYAKVDDGGKRKYILLVSCVQDWLKGSGQNGSR